MALLRYSIIVSVNNDIFCFEVCRFLIVNDSPETFHWIIFMILRAIHRYIDTFDHHQREMATGNGFVNPYRRFQQ